MLMLPACEPESVAVNKKKEERQSSFLHFIPLSCNTHSNIMIIVVCARFPSLWNPSLPRLPIVFHFIAKAEIRMMEILRKGRRCMLEHK